MRGKAVRIKVILKTDIPISIPINYQYQLSSAIYNLLQKADQEYARDLHQKGYEFGSKKFKLFTFSSLFPDFYKIRGKQMMILPGKISFYIGSLKNEFIMNFASGIFSNHILRIGRAKFLISQVEAIPTPKFSTTRKFKCLSPIVATTKQEINGVIKPRDCQLEDKRYVENIIQNLKTKYELIYDKPLSNVDLKISFKEEDIEKYKRGKLICYKNIFIKGFLCPFEASGSPELMEIMWEVGVGEKNSGGFGMVEIIN